MSKRMQEQKDEILRRIGGRGIKATFNANTLLFNIKDAASPDMGQITALFDIIKLEGVSGVKISCDSKISDSQMESISEGLASCKGIKELSLIGRELYEHNKDKKHLEENKAILAHYENKLQTFKARHSNFDELYQRVLKADPPEDDKVYKELWAIHFETDNLVGFISRLEQKVAREAGLKTEISDSASKKLFATVTHNLSVESLHLANFELSDFGAEQLNLVLKQNKHINSLTLRDVGITDSRAATIAAILSNDVCLRKLCLNYNPTDEDFVVDAFSSMLIKNSSITDIYLVRQNGVGFAGKLSKQLSHNKELYNEAHWQIPLVDSIALFTNAIDKEGYDGPPQGKLNYILSVIEADPSVLISRQHADALTLIKSIKINFMYYKPKAPEALEEFNSYNSRLNLSILKLIPNRSLIDQFNIVSMLYPNNDKALRMPFARALKTYHFTGPKSDGAVIDTKLDELFQAGDKLGGSLEERWSSVTSNLEKSSGYTANEDQSKKISSLFIDGGRQVGDPNLWVNSYDAKEPGCLRGMHRAYNELAQKRDGLNASLGVGDAALNMFLDINSTAMTWKEKKDRVHILAKSETYNEIVAGGLERYKGRLLTDHDFRFLDQEQAEAVYGGEKMWDIKVSVTSENPLSFSFPRLDPKNVTGYLSQTLNKYYTEITTEAEPLKKLELLAETYGRLERLHPMSDGNTRTSYIWMNTELMNMGFPPAILNNPNSVASQTPDDVMRDIITGMYNACKVMGLGADVERYVAPNFSAAAGASPPPIAPPVAVADQASLMEAGKALSHAIHQPDAAKAGVMQAKPRSRTPSPERH